MAKQTNYPYIMRLKLRLYPNRKQAKILQQNLNASRFIYNQLLAHSRTDSLIIKNKLDQQFPIPEQYWRYNKKGQVIKKSTKRPTGLDRITTKQYPWLGDEDLDSDMFTNMKVHYQNAWNMFRKVHSAGIPKFKRKDRPVQSYSTSSHYSTKTVKNNGGVFSLYNGSIKFLDGSHIQLPKVGRIKVKLHRACKNCHHNN